jgi:hypothetical protein
MFITHLNTALHATLVFRGPFLPTTLSILAPKIAGLHWYYVIPCNTCQGNHNDSNKQRKLTPPPRLKTNQITQATVMVGKKALYPWPWRDNCINGRPHLASVSSTGSDARAHVPQTKTADHRFYCAVHGHNTTHNGVNCRTMLRDQNVYTRQHLQARQPGDCTNPAGNDNVQFLRLRLH